MVEKHTTDSGRAVVVFRLPPEVKAASIAVVGDFNGWSPTATPMVAGPEGFSAEVSVEAGRRYRYRYLIDRNRWENDWAADDYAPNEFGGNDSVLDLTMVEASGD